MHRINAGIIGATGYAGVELIRLLINHPFVDISGLGSVSFQGQQLQDIYPAFNEVCEQELLGEDEVIAASDVVFGAVPHGFSEMLAKKCTGSGKVFIDIGADFRLRDEAQYRKWYDGEYAYKELHTHAVYGLTELYRQHVAKANIIANPGCYPTSVALGLYPALAAGMVDVKGIVADCKSGVTGAGRGLSQKTHFPDTNENFAPYAIAAHRHNPEIEQTLSDISGQSASVTFVPHLLPINRGILSTIYTDIIGNATLQKFHEAYTRAYARETFVRVLQLGKTASIRAVQCSNYCDISLHMDAHAGKLIVVSAIDNMVKGAAGQAVQNMNVRFGFAEETGLCLIPLSF